MYIYIYKDSVLFLIKFQTVPQIIMGFNHQSDFIKPPRHQWMHAAASFPLQTFVLCFRSRFPQEKGYIMLKPFASSPVMQRPICLYKYIYIYIYIYTYITCYIEMDVYFFLWCCKWGIFQGHMWLPEGIHTCPCDGLRQVSQQLFNYYKYIHTYIYSRTET